ncbi:enoyl-CoA hydratase/isomerase family protein [Bradyrhizobium sp. CCBAU 25338]|uniref:enoyl-CoA hydratase/isomerase family protein n=1 Tax=Bradyrhizobium sp. CCBAU 25338 TaxID=1641877 RepID=UPI002304356E|nr:enoyl-CoA hydratase-related protein [Bradyrhizobium sp. CCBAU 25338]MDA9529020.1 enoyl-CoA hydratase [Bradyrhizobium sp. CCBAU 25338]
MQFQDYSALRFDRRGRVLTITMNRPETLNAVDATLHRELSRVFVDAALDADSDVIVLTGAGRAFCAGGDVAWMQDAIDHPASFETTVSEAKAIIFTLLDCEKPIIARINGPAVGLGATLGLFCDVIFADEATYIADPHVSIGMVAGDGGAVIWPQLIGFARAKEYLLTGDRITARRAAEIGLINHAVPGDALSAAVDAFADRLASGSTKAIRWTKVTANIALKQLAHGMMDTGLAYEALTNISEDHRKRVDAFLKRAATGSKAR